MWQGETGDAAARVDGTEASRRRRAVAAAAENRPGKAAFGAPSYPFPMSTPSLKRDSGAGYYHVERLAAVPPFHRRARYHALDVGMLVFYGPLPALYGIGEVRRIEGAFVAVDFRGTGSCGVHEDVLDRCYLVPLSAVERLLL